MVFGTPNVRCHYVFDAQGRLLAEHDGATGDVVREYVWIGDTPVALIDSSSGTTATYFIHTGQIEEPLVMTDGSKAKVWDAAVEPYGQATVFGTPGAGLDLRLPGQWAQAEAALGGLHQNWHRDYDPSLGRYIEADPLGTAAGQNVYGYVDGRPTELLDLNGLEIRWLPPNTAIGRQSANIRSSNYQIFAHGTIGSVEGPVTKSNPIGVYSARQLADIILMDPDFKRNPRSVNLYACLTGKYNFARELSQYLGQPVWATRDYVFFDTGRPKAYEARKSVTVPGQFDKVRPSKFQQFNGLNIK